MSLPEKETLTVEFKSDRKALSNNDIVETVVALANTAGGDLFIGVEDDGTPSGVHATHQNIIRLAAMIGNKTLPPVAVRTEALIIDGKTIHKVTVQRQQGSLVATSDGRVMRRRLKYNGDPENVPVYPYEFARMLSDIGCYDLTEKPIAEVDTSVFSPLERERLRRMILRFNGEKALLELADDEIEKALGLVIASDNRVSPTIAGALLLCDEATLRELVPTHEVMFQVLDDLAVRVNDSMRGSLLQIVENVLERFHARNEEQEFDDGMFRVPVPDFDERAFREALVNALAHRLCNTLGTVHVQLANQGVLIINPGGFVEGISRESLLSAPPRSRNPRLADALKRIGLAERTGRGVDRIYQGQLRYGRPAPSYSNSSSRAVQVLLPRAPADTGLLRMILQAEQRQGGPLKVSHLLILNALRQGKRMNEKELAAVLPEITPDLEEQLESLMDSDLLQARTTPKGRSYALRAKSNISGNSPDNWESDHIKRVLHYVATHGKITRREAMALLDLGEDQAYRLLTKMVKQGLIARQGSAKDAFYARTP